MICLDALLPNQTLIGSTTDPTFCNMLRTIGLGGIFVMTSLNNRQRRIRRFGVIARIELVDVDGDDNDVNTNDDIPEQYKHLSTPTQVSFSIVGKRRCEILGKGIDMKERIGRWRRRVKKRHGRNSYICLGSLPRCSVADVPNRGRRQALI